MIRTQLIARKGTSKGSASREFAARISAAVLDAPLMMEVSRQMAGFAQAPILELIASRCSFFSVTKHPQHTQCTRRVVRADACLAG